MNVLLIIAIILIGILPILYELRVKIFDFFNVKNLFIAYFLIILPISGYVSLATNDIDPIINLDTVVFNIYYTKAILATLVGLVCFQLGYYGTGNKSIKVPAFLKTTWISTNLSLLYWTFFIVGIGSFLLFLSVNGGLSNFLKIREYFRSEGVSGQGIYMYPSTQLLAFSAFLFFFNSIIIKNKVISFFRSSITIAKVFTFFIICITPSLVFGFRSLTGIFILQFLVIWNYGYKVIPFQKIIFILILLMACFSFYGIYREIPVNEKVSFNSIQKVVSEHPQIVYGILTRVKGTETVAAVIKRLETTKEYDLGYKSVYEALTVPIPHSIWKSKPIPSSVRFTTYFFDCYR
jgi:hypothetical protein